MGFHRLRSVAPNLLLLGLCAASGRAGASGFELYEESPAGTAMAGALTAISGDASAIFYNPAGIAMQRGGSVLIGASGALGLTSVTDGTVKTDATNKAAVLPTAFVSQRFGRFAAGVGLFTQFGSGLKWNEQGTGAGGMPAKFPGRFVATNTQLQSVTINPTIALLATDQISIGVGLDVFLASAELQRQILLGDFEGNAHLGGTGHAIGFNFGALAQIIPDKLSFGIAYRSGMSLDFDLKAVFAGPPELQGVVKDQPAKLSLPLPHNFSVGIAVHPVERLLITADVHATLWSDFRTLSATFPTTTTPALTAPRNWKDSVSARLGLEVMATRGLALRLGFGYDQSPVPQSTLDPTIPVSDRFIVSGGVGYTIGAGAVRGLTLGLGYLAGISADRVSTIPDFPNATYSQTVHLATLGISYRWGGHDNDPCAQGSLRCGSISHY